MSDGYFSFIRIDRNAPQPPGPLDQAARTLAPGSRPAAEAALAAVNRDVAATLPELEPLILAVYQWDSTDHVHVALADGRSQGNPLELPDALDDQATRAATEDLDPAGDSSGLLAMVADAAQETIMEMLWRVWPVCPEHDLGIHPLPSRYGSDGDRHEAASWHCADGGGHTVALIGDLAAALPRRRRPRRRSRSGGGTKR